MTAPDHPWSTSIEVESPGGPDTATDRAARLLAEAWKSALAMSFRLGYADGHDAGRAEAEHEMADAWHETFLAVQATAVRATHDELEARRTSDFQPCAVRCRACSRCIASEAYWVRGGRPYLGLQREAEVTRGAVA